MPQPLNPEIAIILPCYNEASAIKKVIEDFKKSVPNSTIYVYDNNSTDNTIEIAEKAGAIVRTESRQGKGNVVRRMFADVDADIYVMADGDCTYNADECPKLISLLISEQLDMVIGTRLSTYNDIGDSKRPCHEIGNKLITRMVNKIFGASFTDILSGYRVMSKRFVKSIPVIATGFEVETMLTVHALEIFASTKEEETTYFERAEGSSSKLQTFRDGFRILKTIGLLFKEVRPFTFFGILAFLFALTGTLFGVPVIIEFLEIGAVPRFPTAILATGLFILSGICLTCGLILNSVARSKREIKRLHYLSFPNTLITKTDEKYP